jgi:hypothetical protein
MFVFFSIQLPVLNREVCENSHIAELVLVGLQESITANSIYHAPAFKYDFGQQRVVMYLHKLINWSLPGFNREAGILQKLPAGTTFPLLTIPAYIFDRVLRI